MELDSRDGMLQYIVLFCEGKIPCKIDTVYTSDACFQRHQTFILARTTNLCSHFFSQPQSNERRQNKIINLLPSFCLCFLQTELVVLDRVQYSIILQTELH